MKKEIGKRGEELAAKFLEREGYTIFERNYRFEKGEIDIIAYKNDEIIFVEVKTSETENYLKPSERISGKQQEMLQRTAYAYLYERKLTDFPARFDLIIVELATGEVFHYENVFF